MHLTIDQLIELRDAAITDPHLQQCAACRNRLDRLERIRAELNKLADPAPGEEVWPLIRLKTHRPRYRSMVALVAAALAAVAILVATTLRPPDETDRLLQLMTLSNRLENEIRMQEVAIPVGLLPELLGTRSEIALLDREIQAVTPSSPDQLNELWAERVRLLVRLKQVYEAETNEVIL